MQYSRAACWSLVALLLTAAQSAWALPVIVRDLALVEQAGAPPAQAVEVVLSPEVFGPELAERAERDKRGLEPKVIATFGFTNYLLGLLFGKINKSLDQKTALIKQLDRFNIQKNEAYGITGKSQPCGPKSCNGLGAASATTTTTEDPDIPEFERNAVSLSIPSEVFGAGFSILNNIGMTLGTLVQNTAVRTQRFVEALKPVLSNKLGITTRGRSIRDDVESNLVRRRR